MPFGSALVVVRPPESVRVGSMLFRIGAVCRIGDDEVGSLLFAHDGTVTASVEMFLKRNNNSAAGRFLHST
jgi:hypothetical protein